MNVTSERSVAGKSACAPDTDAIYGRIADAIAAHRLPPGVKLGEEALGDIFGVSRTKVRQALFQLASDKLVTLIPGRGAFVARPSVREAREVFEARRMLESALMADFVERATVKDIAALKCHIAEQRVVSATGGANERNRLLGDFHTVIARLAGNEVVAEMVEELVARTSLITLFYQNTGGAAESLDDHLSLMSAIEARDVQAAVRLIGEHLSGVEGSLILKEDTAIASDLKLALALE